MPFILHHITRMPRYVMFLFYFQEQTSLSYFPTRCVTKCLSKNKVCICNNFKVPKKYNLELGIILHSAEGSLQLIFGAFSII